MATCTDMPYIHVRVHCIHTAVCRWNGGRGGRVGGIYMYIHIVGDTTGRKEV